MGVLEEKTSLLDNDSAIEGGKEGEDLEDYDEGFGNDGCSCIGFFCVGRKRGHKSERVSLLQAQGENRESLWRRRLKAVKERTELLCGPKLKNLIRKLSMYAQNINRKKKRKTQFQYDPQSYALNFDNEEDEYGSRLDFISRFAPPSNMNSG